MRFTAALAILNTKKTHADKALFLAASGVHLGVGTPGCSLTELTTWLTTEVQPDECGSVAASLLTFVRAVINNLQAMAVGGGVGRDQVGDFLAEALRTYNVVMHDGVVIQDFVNWFGQCNIAITGDWQRCKFTRHFSQLGYSQATHQVTMHP